MQIKELFRKYISLTYFIGSLLWITLSEYWIQMYSASSEVYDLLQLGKGLLFVFFTTALIHIIINKHRAYKQISEEQHELSTLINAMPDFVCFKDGEGRWIRVNEFGKKLYQLHNVPYKCKTDQELAEMIPFFKDAFLGCIISDEEAWQNGKLTRVEESFPIPSGEIKTFDVIKVPLFHENGKRKGLVTIGRDITQLKAAETIALRKEKLSVVGELAAGIAHEIRNPLTTVKGLIQLQREVNRDDLDHYDIIQTELDRINQIVSELLVFSKPQSKIFKELPVKELIEYVTNLTSHEAILHNIELQVHNRAEDALVFGDKNELIQVLVNVVKNSFDAMPPEGGSITIEASKEKNNILLSVTDTGMGIPKERLEKVGEPFFTLKEKGMGLGLTMSNKIIQEHKGSISFYSEVGKGTRVIISLPLIKNK